MSYVNLALVRSGAHVGQLRANVAMDGSADMDI